MKDLSKLPDNLPVPEDDGACAHLPAMCLPSVLLSATSGDKIELGQLQGTVVLYFYPMIGQPNSPPLVGWNEIPGARGCTPQSCAFRDHFTELDGLGVKIFGVSAQPLADQIEAKARLLLPFELLNDSLFELTDALRLPTFEYNNLKLIKRLTVISIDAVIKKVFYPVFPPDQNAQSVLDWLQKNRAQ